MRLAANLALACLFLCNLNLAVRPLATRLRSILLRLTNCRGQAKREILWTLGFPFFSMYNSIMLLHNGIPDFLLILLSAHILWKVKYLNTFVMTSVNNAQLCDDNNYKLLFPLRLLSIIDMQHIILCTHSPVIMFCNIYLFLNLLHFLDYEIFRNFSNSLNLSVTSKGFSTRQLKYDNNT